MLRFARDRTITVLSFLRDHRLGFLTSPNSDNLGRWEGHFSHCQLIPLTPSTSIDNGRKWVYFPGQKRWVHCIFPVFIQNLLEISHSSCHLSWFICKHVTINTERRDIKENWERSTKRYGPINNKSDNQLEATGVWREAVVTQQRLSLT